MTGLLHTRRLGQVLLRWLRHNAHRAVSTLAGLFTVLVILSVTGAARDDAAIDARTGEATADVLSTAGPRTVVRFATPDGEVHIPQQGVAYPSDLAAGQLVRVEYAVDDPDRVRVAGRSWVVGLLPAALVIVATWLVAGPLMWGLRRHADGVRTPPPRWTPHPR